MNPIDIASPRVDHTLPRNSVIPLTPHPAAANAPCVPQCMTRVNIFDTFEEEHMETPSLPRYNTRERERQHSANQDRYHASCVFRPITFKNTQGFHVAPKQVSKHILMANAVINQDTGAILDYRKMKPNSQSGTKQLQTSLDAWPKVLGGELKDNTKSSLCHAKQYPKVKL
jgi:hypothetical protein